MRMRKSFTIIFTIIFLVVFSALTSMILSLSADTSSITAKLYLYNQAKLLARTGNEIAVLMISNRPHGKNCLEVLNILDGDFNTTLNISYVGSGFTDNNCRENIIFQNSFSEANGTVLIDVYVRHNIEKIIFHRRTIQKP